MKKSYFKYIASLLMFGMNGIVASNINLTSYEIVLTRTLMGSIFLALLFFVTKGRFSCHKHPKDLIFIVVSGIAMGAGWMFLYEAYIQVGVGIASLIYYCGPVIVMALSPMIFNEKLTSAKIIGFIAVLSGVFFVNGQAAESINGWGLFCACMSAVTYAVMVITNKKSEKILGMENALLQLIVSFIFVTIFVGIKSGLAIQPALSDLIWIIILGIINTGVGCCFYFSSIGNLPVQTVAICGYLEPLSAVVFSVILLHEVMLPLQVIGAVLIIGGALFGECFKGFGIFNNKSSKNHSLS